MLHECNAYKTENQTKIHINSIIFLDFEFKKEIHTEHNIHLVRSHGIVITLPALIINISFNNHT